jgi:H+/Cl- antiporter ClcA
VVLVPVAGAAVAEFGGSLAAAVGRWLGNSRDEIRVLVAAGTAAGFAAAYNTPFAAVVFALEPGIITPGLARHLERALE